MKKIFFLSLFIIFQSCFLLSNGDDYYSQSSKVQMSSKEKYGFTDEEDEFYKKYYGFNGYHEKGKGKLVKVSIKDFGDRYKEGFPHNYVDMYFKQTKRNVRIHNAGIDKIKDSIKDNGYFFMLVAPEASMMLIMHGYDMDAYQLIDINDKTLKRYELQQKFYPLIEKKIRDYEKNR